MSIWRCVSFSIMALLTTHCIRGTEPANLLRDSYSPPPQYRGDFGDYRSPLLLNNGKMASNADHWQGRRKEILLAWQEILGPWPPLIEKPVVEVIEVTARKDQIQQHRLRLGIGIRGEMVDAFLLVPSGSGPFPAVVVPYYDAQTGAGLGVPLRDFGWQLANRGFVTLSIGKPNSGVNLQDAREAGHRGQYFGSEGKPVQVQPLSALAYTAACANTFLAQRSDVDADRIGIVGHSFGGKWSLFASCMDDRFACAAWSDPGIVFDDRDRRKENPGGSVNYWDPWYLGYELGKTNNPKQSQRFRKLPSEGEPRTGSYRVLVEGGHDLIELHALMAPRPILVSGGTADKPERWVALNHLIAVNRILGFENRVAMTNREEHSPTPESNEQIYAFFQHWLQPEDRQ